MLALFKFFLYLGATSFGGPLVLVQQMRQYFVFKTKEIDELEFDQAFTLIKAMPGPIAFQMATYLGFKYYRIAGALLAGIGLLGPSFLLMVAAGYFYESLMNISYVHPLLDGFLYSVTAVILLSLKNLVKTYYKSSIFIPLVLVNMLLCWKNLVPEPVLIIGFGLLTIIINQKINRTKLLSAAFLVMDWDRALAIFKLGVISGAVVFGTGFALIPVLKANLVDVHHWITLKEFSDGVIFGQMTPGPITITGTFFGYQVTGLLGAFALTLGIHLIPFFHIVTWFPYAVKWLGHQKWITDFLMGATSAVVASILVTLILLNLESYDKIMFWVLFIVSLVILLLKPKVPIIIMVVGAGLINLVFNL